MKMQCYLNRNFIQEWKMGTFPCQPITSFYTSCFITYVTSYKYTILYHIQVYFPIPGPKPASLILCHLYIFNQTKVSWRKQIRYSIFLSSWIFRRIKDRHFKSTSRSWWQYMHRFQSCQRIVKRFVTEKINN